jgi:hypothetical protein
MHWTWGVLGSTHTLSLGGVGFNLLLYPRMVRDGCAIALRGVGRGPVLDPTRGWMRTPPSPMWSNHPPCRGGTSAATSSGDDGGSCRASCVRCCVLLSHIWICKMVYHYSCSQNSALNLSHGVRVVC